MIKTSDVMLGDTFSILNQSEIAVPFYDNALQMNSDDPAILKKKAEALLKSGRIIDANNVYTQILSQNGNDTVALVRLGDVLMQQGDLKGAVGYYDKALKIDPGNANVWFKKGDAQLLMSIDETQKLHAAAKNLSNQPDSPNYKAGSNDQLESMESYKNAVESYQEAMKLDPKLSIIVSARILVATQNQVNSSQSLLNDIQSSPS
jgi:tetratricopeptide (TPR) repeat protein